MKQRFTSDHAAVAEPTFPGTRAIVRAIAVLKAFSGARSAWGLTELANELSLNKASVFRIVRTLEQEGMLTRDPGRDVYRLGPELIVLGAQALRSADFRAIARLQLEALAESTGESATLEVLVGEDTLILDEVLGRFFLGGGGEIGTRWPAHATSTGKVLLAALKRRGGTLPIRLEARTKKTITSLARLERELARVHEVGYAVAIEELEPGYVAIGAPVHDHEGQVIAAISIGGPTGRISAERIPALGTLVRSAADEVSRGLGASSAALRDSSSEGRGRESRTAG
ncbi:MAG TPA: IclR family transcriptional regulator [Gemmatimonadaceae bacterium]|jgi:DNA-binding IclR family transcriptional regulator|nr:IclR family transcriptional regulator [Gemmatimonadaceae bacterium]